MRQRPSTGSSLRGRQHAALKRRQRTGAAIEAITKARRERFDFIGGILPSGSCHAIPNTRIPLDLFRNIPRRWRHGNRSEASGIATTGESQPEGSGPRPYCLPVVREDAPRPAARRSRFARAGHCVATPHPAAQAATLSQAGEGTMEARFALAASFWRILQSPFSSAETCATSEPRAAGVAPPGAVYFFAAQSLNPGILNLRKNLPEERARPDAVGRRAASPGARHPRGPHCGLFPGRSPVSLPQPRHRVRRLLVVPHLEVRATARSPRPDADRARHGRPCRPVSPLWTEDRAQARIECGGPRLRGRSRPCSRSRRTTARRRPLPEYTAVTGVPSVAAISIPLETVQAS